MAVRPKPRAVVFDIDGVLCDTSERIARVLAVPRAARDWPAYYASMAEWPPTEGWPVLVGLLWESGHTVVLLTARYEKCRTDTEQWLARHDIRYDHLIMRPNDCPLMDFKGPEMRRLLERFEVALAVDDEDAHLVGFRDLGVPCLRVHTGYQTIDPADPGTILESQESS